MFLPKVTKDTIRSVNRIFQRYCRYDGCEKPFYGTRNSKYCEEHRKRKRKRRRDYENFNIEIPHKGMDHVTIILKCGVCGKPYSVLVEPCRPRSVKKNMQGVYRRYGVYPKYCEEHRNEYRRLLYMKNNGGEK